MLVTMTIKRVRSQYHKGDLKDACGGLDVKEAFVTSTVEDIRVIVVSSVHLYHSRTGRVLGYSIISYGPERITCIRFNVKKTVLDIELNRNILQ